MEVQCHGVEPAQAQLAMFPDHRSAARSAAGDSVSVRPDFKHDAREAGHLEKVPEAVYVLRGQLGVRCEGAFRTRGQ